MNSRFNAPDPDIAAEYDFSNARRGVYHEQARRGTRVFHVSDAEDHELRDGVLMGVLWTAIVVAILMWLEYRRQAREMRHLDGWRSV